MFNTDDGYDIEPVANRVKFGLKKFLSIKTVLIHESAFSFEKKKKNCVSKSV